jgi:hypothetical protein
VRTSWDGTISCEHDGVMGGGEWSWDGSAVKLGRSPSSFCNRSTNNREVKDEKSCEVKRNTKPSLPCDPIVLPWLSDRNQI